MGTTEITEHTEKEQRAEDRGQQTATGCGFQRPNVIARSAAKPALDLIGGGNLRMAGYRCNVEKEAGRRLNRPGKWTTITVQVELGSVREDAWMYFEIVGEIRDVEVIAIGGNIDDIMRLRRQFGPGRWRKLKGVALVRLEHGNVRRAELHWYEAHGLGRKKMKIKRFLD